MAIDFPNNPLVNDLYSFGNKTWQWNGSYWIFYSSVQPFDIFVTGGTYSNGTATFRNNSGTTFNVTGFSTSTATAFTGGTVSGATNFTGGLTSNTISGTTISGGTFYGDSSNLQGMSVTNILLTQFFS